MSVRSGDLPSGDQNDRSTVTVSKTPSPALRVGVIAVLAVTALWMMSSLVFSTEPTPLATPTSSEPQSEPSATTPVDEIQASPEVRPELVAALAALRKNPGIGMTLCNAQTKHFDETPKQIERARRYAKCLDDFGIPFRLPTATLHQAYAIPQDLEPSVVLRCGDFLTGPDVSTAAFELFERCARDAEELFGITQVTS